MMLEIGRIIAERYEITEKIGSGGMSIVYKATDKKLSRAVSLKVLREEYSVDDEFRKRFIREARSVASLNHQNIVNVYDVSYDDGANFIVMEYVGGVTLKELIQRRAPFSYREALGVAIQMTSALIHAHNSKIIHRDIKPQNVIVTGKGVIKVADFGIAKKADSNSVSLNSYTTLGSVHYFSPEQAKGIKTDPKSDLYSLGIVMFEMFTGELPFDAETAVSVALMQINEPLPDIHEINPEVDPKIKMIIEKLTQKEPEFRYQSAEELLADLRAVSDNPAAELSFEREPSPGGFKTRLLPKGFDANHTDYPGEDYGDDYEDDYQEQDDRADIPYDDEPYEDEYEEAYEDDYPPEDYPRSSPRGKAPPPARGDHRQGKDRNRDRVVVFAAAATALLLLVAAVAIFFPQIRDAFLQGSEPVPITLPQIVGMDLEQLRLELEPLGIVFEEVGVYDNEVPIGHVIESGGNEGDEVFPGTTIEVAVSLGRRMVVVPNFVALEFNAAHTLAAGQFELDHEWEVSDIEQNTVIRQDPPQGTSVPAGSRVSLYISSGRGLESFEVPNFVGRTLTPARSEAEELGLRVGNITRDYHDTVPENQIISQTLRAGTEAVTGSVINFHVSDGPRPEPEPDNGDNGEDDPSEIPGFTPLPEITPLPPGITPTPTPSPDIMPPFIPTPTPGITLPTPTPTPSPDPTPGPYITPPIHILPTPTPIEGEFMPPQTPIIPVQPQLFVITISEGQFRALQLRSAHVRILINEEEVYAGYVTLEDLPHFGFPVQAVPTDRLAIFINNTALEVPPWSAFEPRPR